MVIMLLETIEWKISKTPIDYDFAISEMQKSRWDSSFKVAKKAKDKSIYNYFIYGSRRVWKNNYFKKN